MTPSSAQKDSSVGQPLHPRDCPSAASRSPHLCPPSPHRHPPSCLPPLPPQPPAPPATPQWPATTAPSATFLTTSRGATSTTAPSATSAARCAAAMANKAAARGTACSLFLPASLLLLTPCSARDCRCVAPGKLHGSWQRVASSAAGWLRCALHAAAPLAARPARLPRCHNGPHRLDATTRPSLPGCRAAAWAWTRSTAWRAMHA